MTPAEALVLVAAVILFVVAFVEGTRGTLIPASLCLTHGPAGPVCRQPVLVRFIGHTGQVRTNARAC